MSTKHIRAFVAPSFIAVLAGLCASSAGTSGCVSDRPSRNGVFNENQYLRKAFIVRPSDGSSVDNGWMMQATIVSTSTPNPLAGINLWTGAKSEAQIVRFNVTSDKLQLLNMREISNDPAIQAQGTRQPEVVNAWPVTNVDLKYQVNLDGEKTNFYQENQELDWQVRQWVKVNFDKNDSSDIAPLGTYQNYMLAKCVDLGNSSVTLTPNSLVVDEVNDYLQWSIDLSLPVKFDDTACTDAYNQAATHPGDAFQALGRTSVNMTLMYSMVRAKPPSKITYQPFILQEKDPIRKKYGTFDTILLNRDPNEELMAGRAAMNRYDPQKPIQWFFAPGYPEDYKDVWTDPSVGIVTQTNALLSAAGAPAQLSIKNYDDKSGLAPGQGPRQFGDIRYSFVRYESDIDTGSPFIGVTQFATDPRSGETMSATISLPSFEVKDRALARLDFYLQTIGANLALDATTGDWPVPSGTCNDGDVTPFDPTAVTNTHNANSPIYGKMQQYLQKSVQKFGTLGPTDFIYPHTVTSAKGVVSEDTDFYKAFFTLVPYMIFSDPNTNPFVVPEGGQGSYAPPKQYAGQQTEAAFHQLMSSLDHGVAPYNPTTGDAGVLQTQAFLDQFQAYTVNHRNVEYMRNFNHGSAQYDVPGMLSYLTVFEKDARHCVTGTDGTTHWESRQEYTDNLIKSYHAQTLWHEFGHAMGLRHNFMGSVDRYNFPHYKDATGRDHVGLYSSSVMDYNVTADRVFWAGGAQQNGANAANNTNAGGWGPYDQGAIAFIYGNAQGPLDPANPTAGMPGQLDPGTRATVPYGPQVATPQNVSGETSPTSPWNDPLGFQADAKTEIAFLFCTDDHLKYTPLCRQFDFGTTPSEIIAADIDNYEWNYKWRNYRLYRKFWNESAYGDAPTTLITEMRRFLSLWAYDWNAGQIADELRRLGVTAPAGVPVGQYFVNLTNQFNADISAANQMVAVFHEALVNQTTGERPYKTLYDSFYGDVLQQGIILDKILAIQSWTALWQTDNYDPVQAQGGYLSSYYPYGDTSFQTVTEAAVDSMVGGQYDIFAYALPLGVSSFAENTHSINFGGRIEVRDWVGGKTFSRERDFLDYMRGLAVTANASLNAAAPGSGLPATLCTSLDNCNYDPRLARAFANDLVHSDTYNQFVGPDGRRYIWVYVADRLQWVLADRDRNTATYLMLFNYTADVINGEDDGTAGAYNLQLPVKYFLDNFNHYN